MKPRIHGCCVGRKHTPTYSAWGCMMTRCNNPNAWAYKYYGAKGVKVCARWKDYRNFAEDMGEKPAGMTLDRFPNHSGNYEPNNCRWATAIQQQNNKAGNHTLMIFGETKTVAQWTRDGRCATNPKTFEMRIAHGWDNERALIAPTRKQKCSL